MKQVHSFVVLPIAFTAMMFIGGCEKSSPSSTSATPTSGTKAGATAAASDAQAAGNQMAGGVAVTETLESLGVTLPSFDELRAKASQAITAENADAEFDRLQLEAEAEGG